MTKYIKIIRFIKKWRKQGVASFMVNTTGDTFIITAKKCRIGSDVIEDREQLRLKYK